MSDRLQASNAVPFGKWSRLSGPGGHSARVERVAFWLADRSVRPPVDVLNVLGHCGSGAEALIALTFAPSIDKLRVLNDRTLGFGQETLEAQVPIEHTEYIADFRWYFNGAYRFVEVYGSAAHASRRDHDRARHHTIRALGHEIHYLPAELILSYPSGAWKALRDRVRLSRAAA